MLSERSGTLVQRIQDYKALRQASEEAHSYETRLEQLRAETNRLSPVFRTREAMTEHGITIELPIATGNRIISKLLELRTNYERDPQTITSQQALGNLQRDFLQLCQRLTELLSAAWANYTQSKQATGDELLLDVFAQLKGFQESVAIIRRLQTEVSTRAHRLPRSRDDIQAFDVAVDQLRSKWSELEGEGVPPSVLEFIRAAASRGAGLELITDEVRTWLIDRGVKESFHVVVRRPD